MSLLREAERCIINQTSHAALNAFITPLQRSGQWVESVREADLRSEQGELSAESLCPARDYSCRLTSLNMYRETKVQSRWASSLY